MTDIVVFLMRADSSSSKNGMLQAVEPEELSETEVEAIINSTDPNAALRIRNAMVRERVPNRTIIDNLKLLYHNRCQICGMVCGEESGCHIAKPII